MNGSVAIREIGILIILAMAVGKRYNELIIHFMEEGE